MRTSTIIKTWRDPYNAGFSPTRPKEITIKSGLTVLVGCNGVGKTTLLRNIESEMKKINVPVHLYNNLSNGGSNSISEALYNGNYELMAGLISSSEGECIKTNLSTFSTLFKEFLNDGFMATNSNKLGRFFASAYGKENNSNKELTKDRFLLFDAVDSGLSVDSVVELKDMFNLLLKDAIQNGTIVIEKGADKLFEIIQSIGN